jgi:hypothetical protein
VTHYLWHVKNESGIALTVGLVIMVLLTAIGTYAINMTDIDQTLSGNLKASKQVFYLADAGTQHAKTFLNQNKDNWTIYGYATPQTLIPTTEMANFGQYTVTIQNAGGGGRRIRATGTNANNASAVIETLMRLGPFSPGNAITVNGDLIISGNPTVTGLNGGVHANSTLSISGNPTISGNATASGTYSASGSPNIGGIAAGGQPLVTIPAVNPADFFGASDYRLGADGNIYDKNGAMQLKIGNKWNGWDYSASKWTLSGNSTIDATLYIEGDCVVSGNPGSSSNPWKTTLICTQSIEISGNPVMRPPTPTDPGALFRTGTENLLFVAGGDIKINGNPQQSLQGILAAHEQVSISGNPSLTGFIIAEDAANNSSTVVENRISGNMTVNYNGNVPNPFPGDVQIIAWQLGS